MKRAKLGMIFFIASEANFFLLLILAYVYYHGGGSTGPTAADVLDPRKTGINTVFLLSSSATMWRAEKNGESEARRRQCAWLAATVLLGAIFLAGQGAEFARLIGENVTISRDLFGTTFFTLTGFHGLHVFVGLLALSILLGLTLWGELPGAPSEAVGVVALYWHFVDVVWIAIFSIVYLWGTR